eukprot:m.130680 g.130680  ORF g.130680 m.130680 type:complete len:61 (+) comp15726_c1_seq1:123-305(+)
MMRSLYTSLLHLSGLDLVIALNDDELARYRVDLIELDRSHPRRLLVMLGSDVLMSSEPSR